MTYIAVAIKRYCIPAEIQLFKVNNGNTSAIYEDYSKLTIKTSERRQ